MDVATEEAVQRLIDALQNGGFTLTEQLERLKETRSRYKYKIDSQALSCLNGKIAALERKEQTPLLALIV